MAEHNAKFDAASGAVELEKGEVIAFPTETVFGIGADASNASAIAKIYDLKGRDEQKPLQILLPDISWIEKLAITSPISEKIAESLMPGPLTMVLERKTTDWVDESTALGQSTIGIRVPDFEETQQLLQAFNKPIAATSANLAGESPANTWEEIIADFNETIKILGNKSGGAAPSTVIKCTEDSYTILREGDITKTDINKVLS